MRRPPQIGIDGALERVVGDVPITNEIAFEIRRIPDEHVIGIELIGFSAESADGLQPEYELCFRLSMAAFHLIVSRAIIGQPINLLEDGSVDFGKWVTWRGRRGDLQEPRQSLVSSAPRIHRWRSAPRIPAAYRAARSSHWPEDRTR